MNRGRRGALLLAASAVAAGLLLLRRVPAPAPPDPPAAARAPVPAAPPVASAAEGARRLRALQDPEAAGNPVEAARRVRDALLAFPALVEEALRLVSDPSADIALRRRLAVILGSLPGPDAKAALARALREGRVAGLEREVVFALGMREIEDGEVFDREGQPYAVEAAPGLWVYVQGPLEDPEIRADLALRLAGAAAADVRLAAARVLRDSVGFPDSREALLRRLGTDADAEVSAEAAAALGGWARTVGVGDPERAAVVSKLFEIVPASEEVVRFRLTAPLSGTPLAPGESARLRSLASQPDAGSRLFAVDVLGRRLGRVPDPEDLDVLSRAALSDGSSDVREAAALALGRAAAEPRAAGALATALAVDADWEVRAAAARSLGRARRSAEVEAALRTALSDGRDEVRAAARRALASLR